MTGDSDHLVIELSEEGPRVAHAMLKDLRLSWPPPEELWLIETGGEYGWIGTFDQMNAATFAPLDDLNVTPLQRISHSKISDDDIATMTHVARGALYVPKEGDSP